MKLLLWLITAALSVIGVNAIAQKPPSGLCTADEEPVFSCTLKGVSRKIVSLCASPESAQGKQSFHYLFGRPDKIELRYPASGNGHEAFTFTHVVFAGATGGGAYAFTDFDYKYILYSVEGTGLKESGLLVKREGTLNASREVHCIQSTLIELPNNELWRNTISKWKADPDIDAHGLPYAN